MKVLQELWEKIYKACSYCEVQNAPPFIIAKEFLMFQQTFCSSEVGTLQHFSLFGTKLTCLSVTANLPLRFGLSLLGPSTSNSHVRLLSWSQLGPSFPPRMSGRWAKCPEVRNRSCVPGEGHKCRVPVGSPRMWLGAGSLPVPLPMQSRPDLTRSRSTEHSQRRAFP